MLDYHAMSIEQYCLETYRLMDNREIGNAACFHFCDEFNLEAPRWAVEERDRLNCIHGFRRSVPKRGRAASGFPRYRQDMIDFARLNEVEYVLGIQQELLDNIRLVESHPNLFSKAELAALRKKQAWFGTTKERAFEVACSFLERTPAMTTPDTIKKTYYRVQREMARSPYRYVVVFPRLLKEWGLDEILYPTVTDNLIRPWDKD